ncbi:MAG: transglycosylase SLT domain-containing protein [Bacteroidales bacterium]
MVPDASAKAHVPRNLSKLAEGIRLLADGKEDRALPLFAAAAAGSTALADYASYYKAFTLLRLGRTDEARRSFALLRGSGLTGFLAEAVPMREAEAATAQGDFQAAIHLYESLTTQKTVSPENVVMGLGRAAAGAGDRARAARAYSRVYYEYPLSDAAAAAGTELESVRDALSEEAGERYKKDLARAQRLFEARRYTLAEPAFRALLPDASSADDRERITLRIAECAFYQRRYREARDGVEPFIDRASRKAEALFFYLTATRELGDQDEYVRLTKQLTSEFGTSSWVEEALNNLASHYIVADEDEKADEAFRELYTRFPKGKYAERAAWKIGWWAYRHDKYADTARFFEGTAAAFPHSDYRPAYLYWAARSHEALGDRALADARYRLVLTDYRNTYYGRLTAARYRATAGAVPTIQPVAITSAEVADPVLPPNAEQIRTLLALDLVDQAMDELLYAQRAFGDSAVISATIAWVHNQRGDLRPGVNLMKRAYPQFMASGGEQLPAEIRKVMYPLDYWSSIKKQASSRGLDPYLIAALILQESTFSPTVRSGADAVGLMQLLAPTGRQYARQLRIKRFSPSMLTRADTNLKLGVAYFADLVKRFGGEHYALASYNAGEHRVVQWMAERQGLSREEFIDDIPFPETQNYVKRILGAADDYRILYGDRTTAEKAGAAPKTKKKAPPKKPAVKKASSKKKTVH